MLSQCSHSYLFKELKFLLKLLCVYFRIKDLKAKDEEKLLLEKAKNDLETFIIDAQVKNSCFRIGVLCHGIYDTNSYKGCPIRVNYKSYLTKTVNQSLKSLIVLRWGYGLLDLKQIGRT